MSFADRLNELQDERSLERRDVFSATGISKTAYHRYVTGEREPTINALVALADFFNVSTDYLLGRTDNPSVAKGA